MEQITIILSIVLPAAAVLFAMYLVVKAFLNKEFQKQLIEVKGKAQEQVLPIRLQAYERICLFLERISLTNLLLRANSPEYNAATLQHRLFTEVREEFGHNMSQQVYMSDQAWMMVKTAVQDVNNIINEAGETVAPEAPGMELAQAILAKMKERQEDKVAVSLVFVKNEIRQLF